MPKRRYSDPCRGAPSDFDDSSIRDAHLKYKLNQEMATFDFVAATRAANAPGIAWSLPDPKVTKNMAAYTRESRLLEEQHEHTEESVFRPDMRTRIRPRDYADGGKFRSIVKIMVRYETHPNRWATGSGYLVAPDIFVTAGNCVFREGYGRCTEIQTYIGYHGRDFIDDPTVQCRAGVKVVVPSQYITDTDDRQRDVAFVKVNEPFEGTLNLFSYQKTPIKDTAVVVGVVGYPSDKEKNEEQAAEMYGMIEPLAYDLTTSTCNMFEHRMSTAASGAPIIKFMCYDMGLLPDAVIATHVSGGPGPNQVASVIGGRYGNDFTTLLSGLSQEGSPAVVELSQGIPGLAKSTSVHGAPAPQLKKLKGVSDAANNSRTAKDMERNPDSPPLVRRAYPSSDDEEEDNLDAPIWVYDFWPLYR